MFCIAALEEELARHARLLSGSGSDNECCCDAALGGAAGGGPWQAAARAVRRAAAAQEEVAAGGSKDSVTVSKSSTCQLSQGVGTTPWLDSPGPAPGPVTKD